jgi:predicted transcriptional regulator of viral defense system
MKHTILLPFERLPYFTTEGFRQLAMDQVSDDAHARIALSRWVKAGHLIALKKGVYMHRRFYEQHHQEAVFSSLVSAILLPQSYLSLEFVLQQHGSLTDVTYPVTAISIKNTRVVNNTLGTFVYRHIRPNLYQGFQIFESYGVPYAQASLAKALFDYIYLHPLPTRLASSRYNLAEELRLNLEDFTPDERGEFASYTTASKMLKMQLALKNLEEHVWLP